MSGFWGQNPKELNLAGADGERIIDLCDRLSALEKFWVSLQR